MWVIFQQRILKKILRNEREIEKRNKRKEEEMAENSWRNKISLSNTISDVYVENNFVSWFNFAIFFRSLCAVIYLVLSLSLSFKAWPRLLGG